MPLISFQKASANFAATEVVITKEMEEEEKQLMEEREREEQEMMIKVCRSLIQLISPSACSRGVLTTVVKRYFNENRSLSPHFFNQPSPLGARVLGEGLS